MVVESARLRLLRAELEDDVLAPHVPDLAQPPAESLPRGQAWSERTGVEEKIVDAAGLFEAEIGKDFELEDVISGSFYHQAVKEAYPEQAVDAPSGVSGKRTKYYEAKYKEVHGIGFSKRRVGEAVKKLLLQGEGDGETLERLKKLTERIWDALQAQVSAKGKQGA